MAQPIKAANEDFLHIYPGTGLLDIVTPRTMENWSSVSRTAVQNAFNALRETITRELQNGMDTTRAPDVMATHDVC